MLESRWRGGLEYSHSLFLYPGLVYIWELMIGTFDGSRRPDGHVSVCQKVISEVADTNGMRPVELDPTLADVIDPDALEELFMDRNTGSNGSLGHIEFTFAGCNVMVSSSGDVTASPVEDVSVSDGES